MMKYDLQMRFVTAPDYISAVGDSYKCDRGEEDPSQVYRDCKLLVLDDIGAQADKEWQRQEMFRLINKRMEDGNITIYTSNMNTDNLNVDTRTRDRIVKTCVELQMPEEGMEQWYNIQPVWAKYKDGYLTEDDAFNGKDMPMFLAEDVEKHMPEAAVYNKDGKIEDWNYRVVIPAMFVMLKKQRLEIEKLKKRLKGV